MIVGKTLAGKYLIKERVRQQSFYDVYIAQFMNTEKRFLVKWVRKELVEPGRTFGKIKPNLMVVASMRHQGIASLRDFGEDESIFLVEDFFDGVPLREVVDRATDKSAGVNALQAVNLGIKITDALHAAHSRGIIHGQITPESVVVSADLNPKISDFYLLHFLTAELKTAVEFQGRDIRYCAPEIVSGSKPTFESDIYSVGIILYELLAGKPPFDRDNTLSIALDKMRADVESIREINPNVPRLLESVVMKCIKRNPESRYKNAGELLSELHLCRSSILRAVADGQQPVQPAAPAPAQTTTPAVGTSQQIPAASQPAGAGAQEKMVTLGSIVGRKEGEAEAAPAQAAPPITAEKPKVAEQQSAAPPPAAVAAARNSSQPQEGVPLKKRKLPRGLVPFLIALGVLIALLAGLFVLKDYFMGGVPIGTVVVPNVEGKSVIEAKALLGNNGLVPMVIDRQNSEEIPEGYILKQLPEAGTTVKSGREVRLILSKGQEKATVPKLVGMTIEDARMLLEKSQLKLGEARKELSDQYEEGIIIDQTPAAGEERYIGRPVNVVVSSGKETRIVTMPRITDLAADQARDILEMNEIKNVRTEPLEAGGVAENAVVAQSVLEGTRVSPGQQVTMYVAAPLSDDSQSEVKGVVSLDISANEGDQEVVVMVFDRNGPREVYRNIHGPGEKLKIPVSGTGKVNVKVYLNGFVLKEQNL